MIRNKLSVFYIGWIVVGLLAFVLMMSIHLHSAEASNQLLTIPKTSKIVSLDGACGKSEYQQAVGYEFPDANNGVAVVALQHDAKYLYVCFEGVTGEHANRFVSVYLDTNGAGEAVAQGDDYSLRAEIESGNTLSKRGTGVYNGYEAFELSAWQAVTIATNSGESAEYAIPVSFLGASCGAPFGVAVYHQWVTAVGNDYGWPSSQFFDQPQTWQESILENAPCTGATDAQLDALHQLEADSNRAPRIRFEAGVPHFVSVNIPVNETYADDPIMQALDYLETYQALYQLSDPAGQLFLSRSEGTSEGDNEAINPMFHVWFGQQFGGIPVYGAELGVHIMQGYVTSTNGNYLVNPPQDRVPQNTAAFAKQVAYGAVSGTDLEMVGDPRLMFVNEGLWGGEAAVTHLTWRVNIRGIEQATAQPTTWTVFVSAINGDVISIITSGSDADRPGEDFDIETVNNTNSSTCWNLWAIETADDEWFDQDGETGYPGLGSDPFGDGQNANIFTHNTYHYFYDTFGRRSWDDDDEQVEVMVHVRNNWQNASYDSGCDHLKFGDGMVTQDIYSHEFTHAVINHSSGLVYRDQPGALNESYADFFGAMVEGNNWTIGEGSIAGTLRSMSNPTTDRMSLLIPPPTSSVRNIGNDWGGVHTNSGIPNKVAYLITDGDTFNGFSISGIGRVKTQRLYYDVVTSRLARNAQFMDARDATVEQAQTYVRESRYGFTWTDVCSVINAFASVGLGTADSDCNGFPDDALSDEDGDHVLDNTDNCVGLPNIDQDDEDGDLIGDACDLDDDGDGIPDTADNCPLVINYGQFDDDGDGIGELCDDDDGDGIFNPYDNCRYNSNYDQADTDGDSQGDACDTDDDNDGFADGADNCPLTSNPSQKDADDDGVGDVCDNCWQDPNPDQADFPDGDGIGNVCDDDPDNDGLIGASDKCPLDYDPYNIDIDNNGLGLVCDDSEVELLSPTHPPIDASFRFIDPTAPVRIPILPCYADGCPDWLASNTRTTVDLTLPVAMPARIVDDTGTVVGKASLGQETTLSFSPRADYYYRFPTMNRLTNTSLGVNTNVFQGHQYYLEIYPAEDNAMEKTYEMTMAVSTEMGRQYQLFLPLIVR